ncbi:Gfo/Idh/MocA family protein [Haloactinomyces albus]|uniref:Dehydrogenase n=1 Tax=Haloactinomyces albus TaxID=1352928 RepID=A0AAE4CN60_9ACTN|nr:Gfo/Idh/MocA family oxidoreductase [Haloactinomyces albus]MDR7304150.1 putative dehydrogenase [Haloactinomyces albus]
MSESNRPLRLGIIGAGRMGTEHARFIARAEGATLAGIADPYSSTPAEEHGVPSVPSHRDLLAMRGIDGVVIANPNQAHVSTALDCIAAGVPALLEKPVATSSTEAAELIDAEASSGVPVLVGHHRRHHPAVAAARETIRGGIGRLVAVNGLWLTKKDDAYFEQSWRREKGAGVLLINLVHDLDLLRHLCGEIVSVQARTSNSVRGYAVEDTASVIVEFDNGALGSFLISDSVVAPWGWDQATEDDPTFPYRPDSSCYSIAGTTGSLSFPQLAHYYHPGTSDWMQPLSLRYEAKGTGESYTNQLEHFLQIVRGEAAPAVPIADAARTLAVIEAAGRAAESGATEAVSPPAVASAP